MARDKVIVKHLAAIQNFGSIDIFCSDKTGTLTAGKMKLESNVDPAGAASDWVLTLACLNANIKREFEVRWMRNLWSTPPRGTDGYMKIDEIPFDFDRRRVSVMVEKPDANGPERLLIAKGAPEGMLPLCTQHRVGAGDTWIWMRRRDSARKTYEKLSAQGIRVLAVGFARVPVQAKYTKDDEKRAGAGRISWRFPIQCWRIQSRRWRK